MPETSENRRKAVLNFKVFAFGSSRGYAVGEEIFPGLSTVKSMNCEIPFLMSISCYYNELTNATYLPAQRGFQFCFYYTENSLDTHSESVGEQ